MQRNYFLNFSLFLKLVPLVLGVGAPKIRNPSLNLGVGTPNIGDPSPSAPKISDPSLNLGVGTPNIGDPSPSKKSWEISCWWRGRVGEV